MIAHTELKPRDACPINYSIDRLRCALCGKVQKPTHDIPEGKYTDKFTSQLILHKYFLALPMYRLDGYQKIVGVPLPNSTQWDIINDAYQSFIPIFNELERTATCAKHFWYDDTRVRILSVIKDNHLNPVKKERVNTRLLLFLIQSKVPLHCFIQGSHMPVKIWKRLFLSGQRT